MEQFLKEQNRKFKNRDDEIEINVVLGNDTCNLDSAISSIIFAYFLYKVRNLAGITIPVLNVKREDFLFRTDVIFFLERWNISITDLICIDEINLQILKEKGNLNLYLVAHSELSKDQSDLQETIIEAIDHRKVSNSEITKGYNSHIEHAASCCTLIAEEILKSSPDILDPQIALIFYTIILFQMLNQEEMGEVDISKDKKVAIKLEKYLEEPDKIEVHKELQKYVDDFNLNNHCFDESNSDDMNENVIKEDNSNKDDLGYHIETVDFPDSPNHRSLLEIAPLKSPLCETNSDESEKKTSNDSEDHDLGIDSMTSEGSAVKKRIFANLSALENDEEEQRSLSSLSNQSNNENFSENLFDIDEDAETLNEVEDYLDSPLGSDQIPEISAREELEEERSWKTCVVNGEVRKIDMKVIEPFRKFLSHGGYEESTCNAIILLSACHLPDRNRKDYNYVMDNLFLYVVVTLDELVAEDYILIYLHGATESSAMPSFSWLKRCYQMIDRRLRKNLKKLYLVHPTFWLKAIVIMTRPFISAKFSKKLQFVYSLKELSTFVPLDNINIPEKVKRFDFDITLRECVDKWKSQSQSMYNIVYRAYTESLRLKTTGS